MMIRRRKKTGGENRIEERDRGGGVEEWGVEGREVMGTWGLGGKGWRTEGRCGASMSKQKYI